MMNIVVNEKYISYVYIIILYIILCNNFWLYICYGLVVVLFNS